MTVQTTQPAQPAVPAAAPGATVVPINGQNPQAPTPYPMFEGAVVEGCVIIISGVKGMDLGAVLTTDDIVRLAGQFKCVKVEHKVDPKTGSLVRYQTLTPRELDVIPFDPADPSDDGIVRSRQIPGWNP
jgi:hypothetical protein